MPSYHSMSQKVPVRSDSHSKIIAYRHSHSRAYRHSNSPIVFHSKHLALNCIVHVPIAMTPEFHSQEFGRPHRHSRIV